MSNNVYDKIDRIYCISLTTTPDKLDNAKNLFTQLGFEHKVRYHVVERHPLGGNVGCFISHTDIIKESYADPECKSVLIFEDDVIRGKFYHKQHMQKVEEFMENNKDWDIIKLGYSIHPAFFHEMMFSKDNTYPLHEFPSTMTHAYIISRKGMKKHIDKFNKININDWDMRNKQGNELYHFNYNFDIMFHHSMSTYNIIPIQFWQSIKDNSSIDHSFTTKISSKHLEIFNEYIFSKEINAKIAVGLASTGFFIAFCLIVYFIIASLYKVLKF
jgi:GR25 family glycosyltransferase involved in LPS biosynthesis